MERVVKILMERDKISQEEAEDLFRMAKEEALDVVNEGGNLDEIEEIVYDYFGLEPDFVEDLIF